MPHSIACPKCRSKLVIKNEKLFGKKLPCPKCKFEFVIPAPAPQKLSEPEFAGSDFSGDLGGGHAAADEPLGGADLADLNVGEFNTEVPQQLAPVTLPQGRVVQSVPAPVKESPKSSSRLTPESTKLLLIGGAIGFSSALVLVAIALGIWSLLGSSGNQPTAASGSPPAASGSSTAAQITASPTLMNRVKELYVKKHKADHPNSSPGEAESWAEKTISDEVAVNRRLVRQFLQLSPQDEEQLKAGKLAKNSAERLQILGSAIRGARAHVPMPPGLDIPVPGDVPPPVDTELIAQYLEVGLMQEVYRMSPTNPDTGRIGEEMMRFLREEDLLNVKSLGDVERVVRKSVESKKIADIRKAASADPSVDVRQLSLNNLKQIGLAFHNYHDTYKTFPAAVQMGPKNIPHSWRVTILPFVENQPLYQKYRQDEPWDSENNRKLLAEIPDVYRSPRDSASTNTSYFGFAFPANSAPQPDRSTYAPALAGNRGIHLADIIDGTSNCILVVESKLDVPWTKPDDIPFDETQPLPTIGGIHQRGFCAVMCDGSAGFFPDSYDRDMLKKVIGRRDGTAVKLPW